MSGSLVGQVAVVTGGGAGIGLACVERLVAEGAAVALVDRDEAAGRSIAERLTAVGGEVVAFPVDATDEVAIQSTFTRSLALEMAPYGVTVNAVAPGVVLSPRVERLHEQRMDQILAATPIGRAAAPDEVADVVWYLAQPGASYVLGATVDVTGGRWIG